MKGKITVLSLLLLIALFLLFRFTIYNPVIESTTQNIEVVKKDKNTDEQWIILSNDKQIYIDDFSIWALIQVNQNYTISYDLSKKLRRYHLKTIVPGDYNSQF
ncbi:hypothetical protein M3197_07015 [Sporosarcina aquimarina]|uniref:hypothetical protein n=1 Tax=Sporosarcina aquimarina TaxID=114975 RepID=UPI002041A718|nr:hypothetical protein [Sporosarcina aquimarina]MCM3757240.1 hypothetical protein [Sporosarcina aquimarina]